LFFLCFEKGDNYIHKIYRLWHQEQIEHKSLSDI